MTHWGVGPPWAMISLAYGIGAYLLTRVVPAFRFPEYLYPALSGLGVALIVIGFPFYIWSARVVVRAFAAGRLVTDGVYGICRHPLYGSWIVFIVPGIELLLRSWFGLTTSLAMYAALRLMAAPEETYLAGKFGESYRQYRTRVPFVLPIGWLRKHP